MPQKTPQTDGVSLNLFGEAIHQERKLRRDVADLAVREMELQILRCGARWHHRNGMEMICIDEEALEIARECALKALEQRGEILS